MVLPCSERHFTRYPKCNLIKSAGASDIAEREFFEWFGVITFKPIKTESRGNRNWHAAERDRKTLGSTDDPPRVAAGIRVKDRSRWHDTYADVGSEWNAVGVIDATIPAELRNAPRGRRSAVIEAVAEIERHVDGR